MSAIPQEARQHNHESTPRRLQEWDGLERRTSPPPPPPPPQGGFSLNSWGAIQSFLMIIVMAVGGIAWGLRLESRLESVAAVEASTHKEMLSDISSLQQQIARGVLPITDVRLTALEQNDKEIKALLEECRRGIKP